MVYGIIGMINFAHGDVFMVGAFISLITLHGAGCWAAARRGRRRCCWCCWWRQCAVDRAVRLGDRAHGLPAAARLASAWRR
jgi:ABC-type branched-subunit amino acid transport system permease subunit